MMNITEENQERLVQLQKAEYHVLEEFDAICRKHGIQYFLAYGTLLGAIRHEGFIPWDDDIDIFMLREEYKRLMHIPKSEIPQSLYIRSYMNTDEEDINITFQTKIESTEKAILRRVGTTVSKQQIWIDVFVVDGMPKTNIGRKLHYNNIQLHNTLFRIARSYKNGELRNKKRSALERLGIKISHFIRLGKYMTIKGEMEKTEAVLAKYKFDSGEYVIGYAPEYGKKRIVPRECFCGSRMQLFEGKQYPIPVGSEELLKIWYGDYMKLPPEEQRFAKHCDTIIDC